MFITTKDNYGDNVKVAGIWQGCNFNYQVDILRDGRIGTIVPCNLHPIPITAEILEKNGWFRLSDRCVLNIDDNQGTAHDGEYVITWYANDDYLTISWGGREDEVLVERTIIECRVKYLPQLQHAIRLAGLDKKINL